MKKWRKGLPRELRSYNDGNDNITVLTNREYKNLSYPTPKAGSELLLKLVNQESVTDAAQSYVLRTQKIKPTNEIAEVTND